MKKVNLGIIQIILKNTWPIQVKRVRSSQGANREKFERLALMYLDDHFPQHNLKPSNLAFRYDSAPRPGKPGKFFEVVKIYCVAIKIGTWTTNFQKHHNQELSKIGQKCGIEAVYLSV